MSQKHNVIDLKAAYRQPNQAGEALKKITEEVASLKEKVGKLEEAVKGLPDLVKTVDGIKGNSLPTL